MTGGGVHGAIDAVWRIEAPRLIAGLMRLVHDLDAAEDLAQDALVAALEQWPRDGIPANPGAWLMTAARRRAIDGIRRDRMLDAKHAALGATLDARQADAEAERDAAIDDTVGDDLLRLILMTCHPVLAPEARAALTLRLLGGLTTAEIARAYLVPEPTIAQRIVRAKRTLVEARVHFTAPGPDEMMGRLDAVLQVVYLIFNEGYAATVGDDWMRPELCAEALRLARVLTALVPGHAEVHGLAALLEIQSSRLAARATPSGEPILLLDQDRARWDALLIRRGLEAFARAQALAAREGGALGPYALQAGIAACHARAHRADDTDWTRIVALYDALAALTESPVVALNRAMAVSMAFGPAPALALVEELAEDARLARYHLLQAARGELLEQLGRRDEARAAFERAAALAGNVREREVLRRRVAALAP